MDSWSTKTHATHEMRYASSMDTDSRDPELQLSILMAGDLTESETVVIEIPVIQEIGTMVEPEIMTVIEETETEITITVTEMIVIMIENETKITTEREMLAVGSIVGEVDTALHITLNFVSPLQVYPKVVPGKILKTISGKLERSVLRTYEETVRAKRLESWSLNELMTCVRQFAS